MSDLEREGRLKQTFQPWVNIVEPNLLSVGRIHWALHPPTSEEFEFDWENFDALGRAYFKFSGFLLD